MAPLSCTLTCTNTVKAFPERSSQVISDSQSSSFTIKSVIKFGYFILSKCLSPSLASPFIHSTSTNHRLCCRYRTGYWECRDERHKPLLLMSNFYSRKQENQVTPRTDMQPVLGEGRGGRAVTQTRVRGDILTQAMSEPRTNRV